MIPARELNARVASAILAAMRSVALADGVADPREMALVTRFQDEMTDEVQPTNVRFSRPEHVRALLERMVTVALADGSIGDEERTAMREIARAYGADEAALAAVEAELRAV